MCGYLQITSDGLIGVYATGTTKFGGMLKVTALKQGCAAMVRGPSAQDSENTLKKDSESKKL
jgi:hypothetical protein